MLSRPTAAHAEANATAACGLNRSGSMLDTENYLQRSSCTPFVIYLLSVFRRARRRVLSADTAYAPPERPARIRVGFSGVSVQPATCACAERTATRARARVANK